MAGKYFLHGGSQTGTPHFLQQCLMIGLLICLIQQQVPRLVPHEVSIQSLLKRLCLQPKMALLGGWPVQDHPAGAQ
jgi:hypothetical protein